METSIDEGIETEDDSEEDPAQVYATFQATRCGQRRHTLTEVTNQPILVPNPGKLFNVGNPSLGSVDSEYDMGSVQSELSVLDNAHSLKEVVLTSQPLAPIMGIRPANPTMQALSSQKRETHNRSPVSFREGRRASDTSLTQGIVAFRQHLQNLARTKGILELNKVQMLYEQLGSNEDPDPLQSSHLLVGDKASLLGKAQNSCPMYCKETPRSLEQQLQEHRLQQKRLFLQKQSQLQAYFNQMQIAEGSYPQRTQQMPMNHPELPQPLVPLQTPIVPPLQSQIHLDQPPPHALQYSYQPCDMMGSQPGYPAQCQYSGAGSPQEGSLALSDLQPPGAASPSDLQPNYKGIAIPELPGLFDCEMMETVDSQHGENECVVLNSVPTNHPTN
uniref:Uncharacterized protein n=1 Tax=Callorhinchus milii TaxID=7868 RepID=A0A4W3HSC2_CALMI